jgi:hypothetical protein
MTRTFERARTLADPLSGYTRTRARKKLTGEGSAWVRGASGQRGTGWLEHVRENVFRAERAPSSSSPLGSASTMRAPAHATPPRPLDRRSGGAPVSAGQGILVTRLSPHHDRPTAALASAKLLAAGGGQRLEGLVAARHALARQVARTCAVTCQPRKCPARRPWSTGHSVASAAGLPPTGDVGDDGAGRGDGDKGAGEGRKSYQKSQSQPRLVHGISHYATGCPRPPSIAGWGLPSPGRPGPDAWTHPRAPGPTSPTHSPEEVRR